MKPLNPTLYMQLTAAFGKVRTSNDGMPAHIVYHPDHQFRQGRLTAEVPIWGETYRVSCPFCNDTRCRLYFSHLWGVRDTRTRNDMIFLVKCHNENCIKTRERQKELHARIFPNGRYADQVDSTIKPLNMQAASPAPNIFLPAGKPLSMLPDEHPARLYLEGRGFDPDKLSNTYDVRYCVDDDHCEPPIREPRIVVPIYEVSAIQPVGGTEPDVRLAGWQARLIAESADPKSPKYLTATGTKKSQLLYGLPVALRTKGPVVIVEGVMDAWKVGPVGMALLGNTITSTQCMLLTRFFPGRPLVVLLDDDADKFARIVRGAIINARLMAHDPWPVIIAKPPAGRHDPGECTTEELKAVIAKAVKLRS